MAELTRTGPAGSTGRWRDPRGWAVLAGCLLVVTALLVFGPGTDVDRRSVQTAGAGTWLAGPDYRVSLDEVRLTRQVTPTSGDPVTASPGTVLVEVRWRLAAERRDSRVTRVTAETHGLSYHERGELDDASYQAVAPGFTRVSTTFFELPADRLDGALMIVGPPPSTFVAYTRVVGFDLGLDDDTPVLDDVAEHTAVVEASR